MWKPRTSLLSEVELVEHLLDVGGAHAVAQAACLRWGHGGVAHTQFLQLGVAKQRRNQARALGGAPVVAGLLAKETAPAAHAANKGLLVRKVGPPAQAAVAEDPQRVRDLEATSRCALTDPHSCTCVPPRSSSTIYGRKEACEQQQQAYA